MTLLFGFDFGPKKIGIAVGQTITGSASPLTTIRSKNNRPDWQRISELITNWTPEAFVVGIPYDLDDTEMDWAPQVYRFSRQLAGRFRLPVYQVDERLTSKEARNLMGRAATSLEAIDAVAAALILETWLSEQH
ncbi:Holliday junction resolvase [Achromatium sp. WMS3]|nr:Holliday junction resolvase [Achromatium sp. WMS3]